jgi:pectin methylesterase-like acyl-CoA thioesterase
VQRVATVQLDDPPLTFELQPVPPVAQHKRRVVVAADGSGDVTSVQAAVNELPDDGGTILVKPGTYRGVVTVRKPNVRLEGTGSDPGQVVIVDGNSAGTVGGTFNSATFFVEADNFFARNLTIANDYDPVVHPHEGGQAVALAVTADRAVFRRVRVLGRQDTLFANSRHCYSDQGPCQTTRQYFADSYIEGNVDFIFGDSRAVFDHCTLHGLAGNVMYTAQDKRYPSEPSGYVFTHCTLTADPGAKRVALGRPWRRYSTVVYLHCNLQAPVIPAGWQEWRHDGQPSLPTSFYAEFDSTGPGASPSTREPYAKQLTPRQAAAYATVHFLGGWNPAAVK